jgi:hypothetical protein
MREASSETPTQSTLNGRGTPISPDREAALDEAEQVPLPMSYRALHVNDGAAFRGFLSQALVVNGVPQARIATETERDPATINLMLSGKQAITADVIAAVLRNDSIGHVITAMCHRYGYEPPRRRVEDLARENQELREWKARAMALLADMPSGAIR